MNKKGVLLVNLGTPDSPSTKDVRKYLREFLMDKYVIDLPYFTRWFLVNLIIAPFRGPKSAKIYQQLWTEKGSPLLYYGKKVMTYTMTKKTLFAYPTERYLNVVKRGYKDCNLDNRILKKALKA